LLRLNKRANLYGVRSDSYYRKDLHLISIRNRWDKIGRLIH